ncbi:MAG: hypothetical protein D9V47_04720 [Clostridia bacterium]|nr:MAG: hypothetical protein D9V47_04720 [Clostridia bacterium]
MVRVARGFSMSNRGPGSPLVSGIAVCQGESPVGPGLGPGGRVRSGRWLAVLLPALAFFFLFWPLSGLESRRAYAGPAGEDYVPARLVAGAVGAELVWIPEGKKLVLGYGGEEVTFTYGSRQVELSSGPTLLAVPPRLENGQFLLPLEAVGLLGVKMGAWYDQPHGYVLPYPAGWEVDNSLAPVRTVFRAPGRAVEVYRQELDGVTPQAYVNYSTLAVRQEKAGIEFGGQQFRWLGDLPVLELTWSRPELALRSRDLNYYRQVNVIASNRVVYTFMLKATSAEFPRASAMLDLMLSGLELFPPRGEAAWPAREPGQEQGPGRKDLLWPLPEKGLVWGIYQPGAPANPQAAAGLEAEIGKRFGLFLTYQSWGRPFPAVDLEPAYAQGRMGMVTLQSWVPEDGTDTVLTLRLLDGDFDSYLRQYARDAARFGQPFFFRFDNEMNGDWDPWCALHYGQDTDLYKEAWRHVYHIFQEEGATNAIFVWNPLDTSYPDFAWNNAHLYYPGDEYVDWVGMTGYNSGDAFSWGRWRSFYQIYGPVYRSYRQLYPGKPLMITEFASHEGGGDKAAWISNAFWYLEHTFPQIKIAVWWNSVDGPRRYYLDSSPAARQAFVTGMQDEYFVDPTRNQAAKARQLGPPGP